MNCAAKDAESSGGSPLSRCRGQVTPEPKPKARREDVRLPFDFQTVGIPSLPVGSGAMGASTDKGARSCWLSGIAR